MTQGMANKWVEDMAECRRRGWYSRWNGVRWEIVVEKTPGAVEDLQRLAHFRSTGRGETDEEWKAFLDRRQPAEGG